MPGGGVGDGGVGDGGVGGMMREGGIKGTEGRDKSSGGN